MATAVASPIQSSQKLAKGASIYAGGLFFGKASLLLTQILLARLLGTFGYGLYSLGYTVLWLLQYVASLGLDCGMLRYCALYRQRQDLECVKGTLVVGLLGGIGASTVLCILLAGSSNWLATMVFNEPGFAPVLRWFALALPVSVIVRVTASFAQAYHDLFRMIMIQLVSQPLLNLLVVVAAFAFGWGLGGAVAAFGISMAAGAVLGLYYVPQVAPEVVSALPARFELGPLFGYSVVMALSAVVYQILLRVPTLMLGYLANAREAGLYAAGATIPLAVALVPNVFIQPFYPLVVELYEGKRMAELRQLYRVVTRWTLSFALPMFMLLWLFRKEIMTLFGRDFSRSSSVLVVLSAGWLCYYANGPAGSLLQFVGRQKLELMLVGIAGIIMMVFNTLLIPRYGAWGAACVTSAAIMAWAVLERALVRRLFEIKPWTWDLARQLAVTAVTFLAGLFLQRHLPWLLAAALTGGIYVGLFLTFSFASEDRETLKIVLARLRGQPSGAVRSEA